MNAPFSIGQKVVAIEHAKGWGRNVSIEKGNVLTVRYFEVNPANMEWHYRFNEISNLPGDYKEGFDEGLYWWGYFAPIQTNYADATAEILEKFKPTEDTPDKILIPEKLKSIS